MDTQKFKVTVAAGSRGAVLSREISANPNDPWPRALQVVSREISKGQELIRPAESVTIQLTILPADQTAQGGS